MIGSFTVAAHLPQTDSDQAVLIGDAEGQAAVALMRRLGGADWQKPTDCPEWDVRALVSHLVGQSEDGLRRRARTARGHSCAKRSARSGPDSARWSWICTAMCASTLALPR